MNLLFCGGFGRLLLVGGLVCEVGSYENRCTPKLHKLRTILHVRGPEGKVVTEQLHDERGILVALLR